MRPTCTLQPYSENNFFKFADDTYFVVAARMRTTLQEELDGVAHWATNNNLRLNTAKSREMLIPRGGRWRTEVPPPLGWSESAPFGSLVSLSQAIFQCRPMLKPCSMQERVPSTVCPPYAESAQVTRPSAKDRCKGNNHQPHPICGSCMVGLRQGTNPAISRPDV